MKTAITIFLILFGISVATAQIEIGLHQDFKLTTMQDDAGNDQFKNDLL